MNQSREREVRVGGLFGGFTFFPYQFAVGVSLRWGEFPALRLYLGPFKVWVTWVKDEARADTAERVAG